MKFKLDGNNLVVTREPGDPKFYRGGKNSWGDPESRFLYHVKNAFNRPEIYIAHCYRHYLDDPNLKFIKKRMWKDGHLVDDCQQYLRTVKPVCKKDGQNIYMSLHNDHYAICGLDSDFNHSEASLAISFITICQPQLGGPKSR